MKTPIDYETIETKLTEKRHGADEVKECRRVFCHEYGINMGDGLITV